MRRADWIGRAGCATITFGAAWWRQTYFPPENNIGSVAVTHALSALCNASAILAAYFFVCGKVSFDLQRLAFCAMVVNLISILSYSAKSSPLVYACNMAVTVISYAQLICMLWPTNGGVLDRGWCRSLFNRSDLQGQDFHLEKKK